jgi:hypothetical protein
MCRLQVRAQIGPVMAELTGQPADFQSLSGAARVGRLILPNRSCGLAFSDDEPKNG